MRVHRAFPSPELRPFVRSILVIASAADEPSVVLPEPGLVIGFRLEGSRATAAVTGLRTTLRTMRVANEGVTVVAALRPMGGARLFSSPLHELYGAMVPLAELAEGLAEVEDGLLATDDPGSRAARVDGFLARRIGARDEDRLVGAAVERIVRSGGTVRIRDLARALGTSQDPLEKRFRRAVGATPKQFASIVRFRRVVAARSSGRTFADIAHSTGYFDQSHLVREFRAFTGAPPTRFFETTGWCDAPVR